jgi:hypothetical protein
LKIKVLGSLDKVSMRVQHNRIEHFHACQIEQRMDIGECDSLCERLRESVSLGPGPHNAVFALPEVLGVIAMLRGAALGDEVTRRLALIEKEFKAWFSVGSWRGRNRGVSFQRDLYTNIWCLKLGIQLRLLSRSTPTARSTPIRVERLRAPPKPPP